VASVDKARTKEIRQAFDSLADDFYNSQQISSSFARLVTTTGNVLFEGLSKQFTGYNQPDHAALAFIRANVFAFSGAKSLVQMKELSNLVTNKNEIRVFSDYKKEALKIDERYNVRYLEAEFNTVVATGQMSRRYWEVLDDQDVFPLLRWDAVNDDRTRPDHARLDKITLPANDPFWTRYWPPIDHNCRCDVQQVRSGRVTPRANAIQVAKGAVKRNSPFFGNAAVDGMAIRKDHSYFNKKDYSSLKAVDYGLKDADTIYEKGGLPRLNRSLTDKDQWNDQWAKWYKDNDGTEGKFTVTDVLDRPITFDAKARDHIRRYHLGADIMDVIQNPDEVYSQDHQGKQRAGKFGYRYIKYFNEKPMVVVVEPDGKALRLTTAFDPEVGQVAKERKGVLHYVDRL
jgi:SPP1 gp7 family putative phage head morphogenesis protein